MPTPEPEPERIEVKVEIPDCVIGDMTFIYWTIPESQYAGRIENILNETEAVDLVSITYGNWIIFDESGFSPWNGEVNYRKRLVIGVRRKKDEIGRIKITYTTPIVVE